MSLESDGGMIYWQGKTEELGEKPVPVPLCPPQIPRGLTQVRTRTSAVRGRWLTTWAMARPTVCSYVCVSRVSRYTQLMLRDLVTITTFGELTPWGRVLLEKQIVAELNKKCPPFTTERSYRAVNTRASYSGSPVIDSRRRRPGILIDFLVVFLSPSRWMPR
jgi:hypothetical protein